MGWITQELSRRRPAQPSQTSEQSRQHTVTNLWLELRDGLQADVAEFGRWGDSAVFDASDPQRLTIYDPGSGLQVLLEADLAARHLRYEFQALRPEVSAPEGGFFSIHLSPQGQAELFSADQPLTCEQARRVLLQPVLFPADTSTPLRQSA